MKSRVNIAGGVLVLLGTIWFLQGTNVLPGSFMTGQVQWAVYGGIAVKAGIAILLIGNRRRTNSRQDYARVSFVHCCRVRCSPVTNSSALSGRPHRRWQLYGLRIRLRGCSAVHAAV